jgi:hypothetical protein
MSDSVFNTTRRFEKTCYQISITGQQGTPSRRRAALILYGFCFHKSSVRGAMECAFRDKSHIQIYAFDHSLLI